MGFLATHGKKLKPDLPFYLGGEECFCTREVGPASAPVFFGALDRKAQALNALSKARNQADTAHRDKRPASPCLSLGLRLEEKGRFGPCLARFNAG